MTGWRWKWVVAAVRRERKTDDPDAVNKQIEEERELLEVIFLLLGDQLAALSIHCWVLT